MATKQRQGYPCDEANDVHGLGVILYECATLCKIQIVEREMKTQDEKMELARKMKQVPKTHVGAVATLIEECLSDVKQPTSMKVAVKFFFKFLFFMVGTSLRIHFRLENSLTVIFSSLLIEHEKIA